MNYRETMAELKSRGTAQNRKVYGRHGVTGAMFGVSYADLGKLRKKIKTDHALALKLWSSGNHDARVLATMIADPDELDGKTLEAWVKELDNHVLTAAVSDVAARSTLATKKLERWVRSRKEFVGAAGFDLLARLAMSETELPDADFAGHLKTIEEKIHRSPNRTRYSMNGAMIAIGLRTPALEKKAIAAAKRIGPVEVDHGETGCKTPEVEPYIRKAKASRAKRKRHC